MPIKVDNIAYLYIHERILFFKTFDAKKFIIDYTMDEVEQMLDPQLFFRINRSFIVSVKSVLQVHDYFNSRLVLNLQPFTEEQVIVSREK